MTINQFAVKVTEKEGKKQSVSIAQVLEMLKIMQGLLKPMGVDLYTLIKRG